MFMQYNSLIKVILIINLMNGNLKYLPSRYHAKNENNVICYIIKDPMNKYMIYFNQILHLLTRYILRGLATLFSKKQTQ